MQTLEFREAHFKQEELQAWEGLGESFLSSIPKSLELCLGNGCPTFCRPKTQEIKHERDPVSSTGTTIGRSVGILCQDDGDLSWVFPLLPIFFFHQMCTLSLRSLLPFSLHLTASCLTPCHVFSRQNGSF